MPPLVPRLQPSPPGNSPPSNSPRTLSMSNPSSAQKPPAPPPPPVDDDDLELSSVSSDDLEDDEDVRGHHAPGGNIPTQQMHEPRATPSATPTATATASSPPQRRKSVAHDMLQRATAVQTHLQQQSKAAVEHAVPAQLPLSARRPSVPSATPNPLNSAQTPNVLPLSHADIARTGSSHSQQQPGLLRKDSSSSLQAPSRTPGSVSPANPIKRQSIADIRRALSIASTPSGRNDSVASVSGPGGEEARVANLKVKKIMTELLEATSAFKRQTLGGDSKKSVGDATFAEIRRSKEVLEQVKLAATQELITSSKQALLLIESHEVKNMVLAMFEELLKEDDTTVNTDLLAAIMSSIVSIDFQVIAISRQLFLTLCEKCKPNYLALFLNMSKVQEVLSSQHFHEMLRLTAGMAGMQRICMLTVLLKQLTFLDSEKTALREQQPLWQDLFEQTVATRGAAMSPDDESKRMELVRAGLNAPRGYINFSSKDSGDKQTIFSRACREGDSEFVLGMLTSGCVDDVNRVQPDGTNALQQAAARGHLDVVQILCRLTNIAPSLTYAYPGRGTAIELAHKAKNRNQAVVDCLVTRAVELRLMTAEAAHEMNPKKDKIPENVSPPAVQSQSPPQGGGTQSSASPESGVDRHASKANLARRKSMGAHAFADGKVSATAPLNVNGVVDGTTIVKLLLTVIKPLYEQIKYEASFDPPDLKKLGVLKNDLQFAKDSMTLKINRLESMSVEIRKDDVKDDVLNLMDEMIHETSKLAANIPLFECLLTRLAMNFDFLLIAQEKRWFNACAKNGSIEYLAMLFELPGTKEANLQSFQTKEMIEHACQSTIYRIDTLHFFFQYEDTLNLEFFAALLKPCWQQAFTDIACQAKAKPLEQRGNRLALLKTLLEHPQTQCDAEAPADPGNPSSRHTVFSQACLEGDAPFVYLLLNPTTALVRNPNRIVQDGMTALMHACAKGHLSVVECFVQLAPTRAEGTSLLSCVSELQAGNAANVAQRAGHTAIVELLEKNGIRPV